MLEAMNTGCHGQAAWQDLWLHSAIKLLGGRVYIGGWDADRVSVSISDPESNVAWRSSCMARGSLHLLPVQVCSYRSILEIVER